MRVAARRVKAIRDGGCMWCVANALHAPWVVFWAVKAPVKPTPRANYLKKLSYTRRPGKKTHWEIGDDLR